MIKMNRTTEYGLMALRHMSRKRALDPLEVTSAREVADFYGLPFEITAKTLQRLKDTGLIQSAQGAKGGYTLQRNLEEVSLARFLELMEGPQSIVACSPIVSATQASHSTEAEVPCCHYEAKCEIRKMMGGLTLRIYSFLSSIRLAELTEDPSWWENVSSRQDLSAQQAPRQVSQ